MERAPTRKALVEPARSRRSSVRRALLGLGLLLSLAAFRKSSLLTSVVRTRFQFVVLTDVAEEEQSFLSVFSHRLLCSCAQFPQLAGSRQAQYARFGEHQVKVCDIETNCKTLSPR